MSLQPHSPGGRTHQESAREVVPVVDGSTGRAITPRDLAALRPFFEECAHLSAEAALLAVLVARIGERKRMVIHPSDLMEDLGKRLHWRDEPERLHPKVVGTWLRALGFSSVGRDRLGLKYEIRWEQLWGLDPREISAGGKALNVFALDGAQLLRLLAKEQRFFFTPKIWCPGCQGVIVTIWGGSEESPGAPPRCPQCDGPTHLFADTWLTRASARIRRAIRDDPNLLPAVKAEWEEVHDAVPFPSLAAPFDWFNAAWERAGKPRGRPGAVLKRYQLAHAIDWLERAHVSKSDIEHIFAAHGKERQELYNDLPDPTQRFLGSAGEAQVLAAPSVGSRTLWASVQWARRQWTNPRVRLRGEGTFPAVVQRQTAEMEVSTESGLGSSESPSDTPQVCPRCGNSAFADIVEDDLRWVQCGKCGWWVPLMR